MYRLRVQPLAATHSPELPVLAEITDPSPPAPTALRAADRTDQAAIDDLTRKAGLAA